MKSVVSKERPDNEAHRLLALNRYKVLDTPPEGVFDQMTALCARIFHVPLAALCFVDFDRIWVKSCFGTQPIDVDRTDGIPSSVILRDEMIVIEDLSKVERPSALYDKLGFYASAPLRTPDGFSIGTFCIADYEPRKFDAQSRRVLTEFARLAMEELEERRSTNLELELRNEVLRVAAHDLKNPLLSVIGFAREIADAEPEDDSVPGMANIINRAARGMLDIINELMLLARIEAGALVLDKRPSKLCELVQQVIDENTSQARQKKQIISLSTTGNTLAPLDWNRAREIVDNLISNAIKFSPIGGRIEVEVTGTGHGISLVVRDEGDGLTEDDKKVIFRKFARLHAKPTGGEERTGLGLSIVKELTELHGGTVIAESEGAGRGSSFTVTFPLNGPIE